MIETKVDAQKNLTLQVCTGPITIQEISEKVREFYDAGPTRHIVWDLSSADTSGIASGEIQDLARLSETLTHSRIDGKTAIVSGQALTFGLGRMYQSFAELAERHPRVEVFRTLEEALKWVQG